MNRNTQRRIIDAISLINTLGNAAKSNRTLDYSPSQPRDDHGRWTDGGGGSAVSSEKIMEASHIFNDENSPYAIGGFSPSKTAVIVGRVDNGDAVRIATPDTYGADVIVTKCDGKSHMELRITDRDGYTADISWDAIDDSNTPFKRTSPQSNYDSLYEGYSGRKVCNVPSSSELIAGGTYTNRTNGLRYLSKENLEDTLAMIYFTDTLAASVPSAFSKYGTDTHILIKSDRLASTRDNKDGRFVAACASNSPVAYGKKAILLPCLGNPTSQLSRNTYMHEQWHIMDRNTRVHQVLKVSGVISGNLREGLLTTTAAISNSREWREITRKESPIIEYANRNHYEDTATSFSSYYTIGLKRGYSSTSRNDLKSSNPLRYDFISKVFSALDT